MTIQIDDYKDYTNTYLDTRGAISVASELTFTEAILTGIASGGGLFVPRVLPRFSLDELEALTSHTYAQLAAHVYRRFGTDLPSDTLATLMQRAYGTHFDHELITPVRSMAPGIHVLELWHGPTSAFKDMALQCLPLCFSAAIEQLRAAHNPLASEDFLILVATSGDTGKAALEGFADRDHTGIIVFYPDGGVSDIQFKQMATQAGSNVGVFGVRGNFDHCQTAVKGAFGDEAFSATLLREHGLRLSSANSINWGRLLPQVIYYLSAYLQLLARGEILLGEPVDVCVPTGNFGNILACWYAKECGVPIDRLLCASNDNRVLTDFLNTGTYDISDRSFVLTPSPSMDILVSSNLERQLFELCGRDPQPIRTWMAQLRDERRFKVDAQTFAALRAHFSADWVSADESLDTIREVYEAHSYLIDPHTAVGWKVAERLRSENPVIIAATAHWAKFGTDVYRALNHLPAGAELPNEVAALTGLELNGLIAKRYQAGAVPPRLASLDSTPLRFTSVIDGNIGAIEQSVFDWLCLCHKQ